MLKYVIAILSVVIAATSSVYAANLYETDTFKTSSGDLEITFIGHSSLMFKFGGKVIYVDPWTKQGDYSRMPKADLVLVTHEHYDHLDPKAIATVRTPATSVVLTSECAKKVRGGIVMKNGDVKTVQGLKIEAVPAYNIVNKRPDGTPWHPKGRGNGYVVTFGDKRVYIAGDTENIPEMRALKNIYIAFLPMNLPYTMSPEMTASAAKTVHPKILYPYHYGKTDTSRIVALLKDVSDIDVRIRRMP
ncbi:MAG: MBL fold metallo-hydrolase [Candidatus Hydrogenedentes bacterium]|nr:MBL fold metallo-hydrolase [Candidatus Hydrogenedentota bacterium]